MIASPQFDQVMTLLQWACLGSMLGGFVFGLLHVQIAQQLYTHFCRLRRVARLRRMRAAQARS